ncbi:hypothetical protein [Paenibacillus soyae]|uniref:Uncharacterized protein n=1 Tax=Paenibacillus soyae TaxID=2969249 RepID=A0A9X2MTH2_9BACL|nr:hypothetical protein [Paenibacillus soyae]MCR2806175.1 hypothetical protein [Paenibacillus soyae]
MHVCFAEYRILPEFREQFLVLADKLVAGENGLVQLYEGTDQPGLFVEIWQTPSEEEAERVKEERLSGHSSWSALSPWIAGGTDKLHVWTFKPAVSLPGSG